MQVTPLSIPGAFKITPAAHTDQRGCLARTWDATPLAAHGLPTHWPQHNVVRSARQGTLRALHWQRRPDWEAKLVRCVTGRAFDVVVDLRQGTPGFGRWEGVVIDAAAMEAVFVPEGCGHGILTLADDTEILYLMGASFRPEQQRGCRWDDPDLAIAWPLALVGGACALILSDRDRAQPPLAALPPEDLG